MIIGEAGRRRRALGGGAPASAAAARGPAGPAGLRDRRAAAGRARPGLRAATPDDLDLLVPACAAAHALELGIDPLARDDDGFRWRTRAQIDEGRSWVWLEDGVVLLQGRGVGVDAAGGAAAAGLGRPGGARPRRRCARPARPLPAAARDDADRDAVRPPRERAAIALYESIGMRRVLEYRSVLF